MIRPDTDQLIAFLNEALTLDPEAISLLFSHRVPCNESVRDHESIQVGTLDDGWDLGILGLLNGYCGTIEDGKLAGWGAVASVYDKPGGRLVRFCRTDEAQIQET